MSFRLVPQSVTLNDLEWRKGPYVALFHRIQKLPRGALRECVRVRCRRKESSCWLSHLLVSFLFLGPRALARSRHTRKPGSSSPCQHITPVDLLTGDGSYVLLVDLGNWLDRLRDYLTDTAKAFA